ncbi:MAG: hypothetical protein K0Q49_2343 [Haloplasmataceae bacterium]|jgi:phage-related protein|nr:hypothetical protein [Haloplasmataceae bacterium]
MSSINESIDFIFAGESSKIYGVSLASAFGSTTRSSNVEIRNIVTTTNGLSNIFNFHYVKYDSPMSFDIIIYNLDGSWIDANKERILKKWLLKSKRNWFQVDQSDLADAHYYVIGVSAELINVGIYSGGMKISFICDSPWAWSSLQTKQFFTVSGTLNKNLYINLDFDEYIISPTLAITALSDGNISVTNSTTGETVSFTGCISGEIIIIECSTDKVNTSLGTVILDRWNKNTLSMKEGINSFNLVGNFSMLMKYRLPIRVGG